MTLGQIKQAIKNTTIQSASLKGAVLYNGVCFYLNGVNFKPSKAQIKTLYSESLQAESSHYNEYIKGCFYEL